RDALAAMDFFVVPTVTFRTLHVWFAIGHGRRRVLRFDVTDHPAATWGNPETPRGVPIRRGSAPADFRSGCNLLSRGRFDGEILRHQADKDGLPQPLAERRRRALDRQRPSRAARPRCRA